MGDWIDNILNAGDELFNSEMVVNVSGNKYNPAQRAFGTAGEAGLTQFQFPKLKYSFIVEFVLSEAAKAFINTQLQQSHGKKFDLRNVSCFVRDVQLPDIDYGVEEFNQYNKSRFQAGKISYKPFTLTFFDTPDSSAQLLLNAYQQYYYGDFHAKNQASFTNDTLSSPQRFEGLAKNWGRIVMNNGELDQQYFFKQINVYEIDNQTYTVHNFMNAYISNSVLETKSQDSSGEPSSLTLTLNYEGVGNYNPFGYHAIGNPTAEIAPLVVGTARYGKAGYFRKVGEMDDPVPGFGTWGDVIGIVAAGGDVIDALGDIFSGDITAETIRNLGDAIDRTTSILGFGNDVSQINNSFGLGNVLGDF